MAATAGQVQNFSDQRCRPRSETVRDLYNLCKQDSAAIGDVYAALTGGLSNWTDARTDGPPHLATANDVLAWNTFIVGFIALVEGGGNPSGAQVSAMASASGQYPIIQKLCIN